MGEKIIRPTADRLVLRFDFNMKVDMTDRDGHGFGTQRKSCGCAIEVWHRLGAEGT